jgi:hypothetical protein
MNETNITLLSIITIAAGVLQIILFFKIWGMTNDVRKMQTKFFKSPNGFYVKKAILLGDKEQARDLLIEGFFNYIHEKIAKGEYYDKMFPQRRNQLADALAQLGFDMPEAIKSLNSINDLLK